MKRKKSKTLGNWVMDRTICSTEQIRCCLKHFHLHLEFVLLVFSAGISGNSRTVIIPLNATRTCQDAEWAVEILCATRPRLYKDNIFAIWQPLKQRLHFFSESINSQNMTGFLKIYITLFPILCVCLYVTTSCSKQCIVAREFRLTFPLKTQKIHKNK